jgi:hypothetical protein
MESEDPGRVATFLIHVYGAGARGRALIQVASARQSGDLTGLAHWKAVLDAVLDFERFDPADERTLH